MTLDTCLVPTPLLSCFETVSLIAQASFEVPAILFCQLLSVKIIGVSHQAWLWHHHLLIFSSYEVRNQTQSGSWLSLGYIKLCE